MQLSTLTKATFPTRKDEDWHYSQRFFNHPAFHNRFMEVQATKPACKPIFNHAFHLIVMNGKLDPGQGNYEDLQEFIKGDSTFVFPPNTCLDSPIEFLFMQNGSQPFFETDFTIEVGANAKIELIETYLDKLETPTSITANQFNIRLHEKAKLYHYLYQDLPNCNHLYTKNNIQLGAQATYHKTSLNFGSSYHREEIQGYLAGRGAQFDFKSLFLLGGEKTYDLLTKIKHASPDCTSSQDFRGVLFDQASAYIQGGIRVDKDAQKTKAFQNTKTLLLSENTTLNAKPELKIYADDVECRHGATTGQLSPEALFYLKTRAIDEETAKKMLIEAFLTEQLSSIENKEIRSISFGLLKEKNDF